MPLGDAASSPLERQEALRRRADEASAELDNLRHANQHLQELVRQLSLAGMWTASHRSLMHIKHR